MVNLLTHKLRLDATVCTTRGSSLLAGLRLYAAASPHICVLLQGLHCVGLDLITL